MTNKMYTPAQPTAIPTVRPIGDELEEELSSASSMAKIAIEKNSK